MIVIMMHNNTTLNSMPSLFLLNLSICIDTGLCFWVVIVPNYFQIHVILSKGVLDPGCRDLIPGFW